MLKPLGGPHKPKALDIPRLTRLVPDSNTLLKPPSWTTQTLNPPGGPHEP